MNKADLNALEAMASPNDKLIDDKKKSLENLLKVYAECHKGKWQSILHYA